MEIRDPLADECIGNTREKVNDDLREHVETIVRIRRNIRIHLDPFTGKHSGSSLDARWKEHIYA